MTEKLQPYVQSACELMNPMQVDFLFGMYDSRRTPLLTVKEKPTFVFLIGAPAAGKSTGHTLLQERGIVQRKGEAGPRDYATINVDTLLESLIPFREATATAAKMGVPLTALRGYVSKQPNLGFVSGLQKELFPENVEEKAITKKKVKVANATAAPSAAFEEEKKATCTPILKEIIGSYADILEGKPMPKNLNQIMDDAIRRIIKAQVDIVYETTFSSDKKFMELYEVLKGTPYKDNIKIMHIQGNPGNVGTKAELRQRYGMPSESVPFQRLVPTTPDIVADLIKKNQTVFDQLRAAAPPGVSFIEQGPIPYNASKAPALPAENARPLPDQLAEMHRGIFAPLRASLQEKRGGGKRRTRRHPKRNRRKTFRRRH
jgi:hypothetical protein